VHGNEAGVLLLSGKVAAPPGVEDHDGGEADLSIGQWRFALTEEKETSTQWPAGFVRSSAEARVLAVPMLVHV
jgi:hypothetical protein